MLWGLANWVVLDASEGTIFGYFFVLLVVTVMTLLYLCFVPRVAVYVLGLDLCTPPPPPPGLVECRCLHESDHGFVVGCRTLAHVSDTVRATPSDFTVLVRPSICFVGRDQCLPLVHSTTTIAAQRPSSRCYGPRGKFIHFHRPWNRYHLTSRCARACCVRILFQVREYCKQFGEVATVSLVRPLQHLFTLASKRDDLREDVVVKPKSVSLQAR